MALAHVKTLSILAPAKVNLFLHITGKRDDGLHLLDSLVAFTDIGDEVKIERSTGFSFNVKGPFASSFEDDEQSSAANSKNIVVKAARALALLAGQPLDVAITLHKNLPLASGVGGGSSDAAACIWGLMKLWSLPPQAPYLNDLLLTLGADVPVCYQCQSARMRGIGEDIEPLARFPEVPILLVNSGIGCSTADIFSAFGEAPQMHSEMPSGFDDIYSLCEFLKLADNHLYSAALQKLPVLPDVIKALQATSDVLISRMSGSGGTCFALYDTAEAAQRAAEEMTAAHPTWWVKRGWLNRPERY
jgi:4-diphosphocytidyl-2-C-methyl-D-erythritol kinase|tara:strand:+ start:44311 stop:45219 length:909 start_codon:yes stop_codon:yes gene_type:complete